MEKVTELLQQLAEKLGTTVEYLWGVLIRQQSIEAIQYFVWSLVLIVVIIVGLFIVKKISQNLSAEKDRDDLCSDRQVVWNIYLPIVGVSSLISIGCLIGGIKLLLSPEYYALQEVLRILQ